MRWMISIYIVQLSIIHFIAKVKSLTGPKVYTVDNGEFPFIAFLQFLPNGPRFCTGSLISRQHVLTSAHCMENKNINNIGIVLGVVDLRNVNTIYHVAWWVSYDEWADMLIKPNERSLNDIGILKLNTNQETLNVNPVRLSELNKKQVQGKSALMIGWKQFVNTELLQKGKVKILNDTEIIRNDRLIRNQAFKIVSDKILYTAAEPYVLSEHGDSGGPLLDQFGELLGVLFSSGPNKDVSWAEVSDCFLKKYQMNVYFSADYYRFFIYNVTDHH